MFLFVVPTNVYFMSTFSPLLCFLLFLEQFSTQIVYDSTTQLKYRKYKFLLKLKRHRRCYLYSRTVPETCWQQPFRVRLVALFLTYTVCVHICVRTKIRLFTSAPKCLNRPPALSGKTQDAFKSVCCSIMKHQPLNSKC